MRRDVDHEHGLAGIADLLGERVEPGIELVLGLLPRRLPRRVVRPAGSEQLEVAGDVEHLAVGVDGLDPGLVEDRVDHEVVVVAGDQVERRVAVGQPLGRELHPRVDALVHQVVEQLVAARLVGGEPLGLLGGRDERVVADVGDVALELGELVVAARAGDAPRTAPSRSGRCAG